MELIAVLIVLGVAVMLERGRAKAQPARVRVRRHN